ncbi:hypothetical protein MA16_Dca016098 [Dendrobium catenatum]|uniref:Uncharacterized protein n=1 Tax=Dendrobium catenatum TaxID=906689 RepID=A0A2I0WIY7_9ASPA|nr:hypothetical protein MA16_Dca016098 [Dendrobium catenatum]
MKTKVTSATSKKKINVVDVTTKCEDEASRRGQRRWKRVARMFRMGRYTLSHLIEMNYQVISAGLHITNTEEFSLWKSPRLAAHLFLSPPYIRPPSLSPKPVGLLSPVYSSSSSLTEPLPTSQPSADPLNLIAAGLPLALLPLTAPPNAP